MTAAIRYATLAAGATKRGHLLGEKATAGRGRSALCGERRIQWRPVANLDRPGDIAPCAECDAAAALIVPEVPVRIAPAAIPRPGRSGHVELVAHAAAENTQQSRVRRRAAFRDSFVTAS